MMDNDLPIRKQNRLQNHDYSQNGAYFITICTKNKAKLFWEESGTHIVGEAISLPQYPRSLNRWGQIVYDAICSIPNHYPGVFVDKFVVMPNHVHLILTKTDNDGRIISAPTVSLIVGQMKRFCSKQIGLPIWQRSFHDHIIRDEHDYLSIWQYIDTNPLTWEQDCFYTEEEIT